MWVGSAGASRDFSDAERSGPGCEEAAYIGAPGGKLGVTRPRVTMRANRYDALVIGGGHNSLSRRVLGEEPDSEIDRIVETAADSIRALSRPTM